MHEYNKGNVRRLLVGYTADREKKDDHNREKGIKRLEKSYKRGKLTKESINKRGYNKFLDMKNEVISKVMIMKRHKATERLFDENF